MSIPRYGLLVAQAGAVIRRILRHLQLPAFPAVLAPARGPAQQQLWV